MKRLLSVVGGSLCLFSVTLPAMAQAVRTLSTTQARGEPAIVTLDLYPGHGTTLNFRATGEIIQRAWLDDLSQVTLSFDDPRCGLSETREAESCAAQMIHLRRINPLTFPHLPATATTLLTVLTDRGLYVFRLSFPASGQPTTYAIEVQPDDLASEFVDSLDLVQGIVGAQQLISGLNMARSRQWIEAGDPLWQRVQGVISAVQQGVNPETAAAEVGVSPALLRRLVELGQGNSNQPLSTDRGDPP